MDRAGEIHDVIGVVGAKRRRRPVRLRIAAIGRQARDQLVGQAGNGIEKKEEIRPDTPVKLNMTFEQAMKKALNTKLPDSELNKKEAKKK